MTVTSDTVRFLHHKQLFRLNLSEETTFSYLYPQFQILALRGRWHAGHGVSTTLRPLMAYTTTSQGDARTLYWGTVRKPPRPASLSRWAVRTDLRWGEMKPLPRSFSVQRLPPVGESLDSVASCTNTHFFPDSDSARGKDLLWRLVKAIWLLESITIKYCNYPLCLESICNRLGLCSPEHATDTLSVQGKTNLNWEH